MARGIEDKIKDMKEDFKDLDLAIMDGAKQFATLSASISKTNNILASKNWIIFSRFISGTPLWQFQNRIKATVMLLNEIQQKGEKRRTEEAKEIQNFAKIAKMRRKAKDLQQSLLDIEKATGNERKQLVDALKDTSEQYEGLTMKLGSEEAATQKLLDLMNERVSRADKLQKKAEEAAEFGKADFKTKMKYYSGLTNAQKAFSAFKKKKDKEGLSSFIVGNKKVSKEMTLTQKALAMAMTKSFDTSGFTDKEGNVKKPRRYVTKKGMMKDSKGRFISKKQYDVMMKIYKLNKFAETRTGRFITMLKKPIKAVVFGIGKMVFYLAAQFMKTLLLLMVVVAAFKFIQPFLGNIFDAIVAMATTLYTGIMMIVDGITAMFTGVYNILAGIYNMDFEQIFEGISQIVTGFANVLGGIIVATFGTILSGIVSFVSSVFTDGFDALGGGILGIVNGVMNVVKGISGVVAAIALVAGAIGLVIGAAFAPFVLGIAAVAIAIYFLSDGLMWILGQIADPIRNLYANVKDFVTNFSLSDAVTDLIAGIKEAIGGILDKIPSPGDAVKSITSKIPFLANGGTIQNSGIAVVGERGPELVNLPAGARVSSNRDSAAMMGGGTTIHNHVTVQVTGRVGANDTEIRDIANKVAKEINSRMNRTSTSVVRF